MSDINFATSTVERRQEYFKHSKHTNGFDFLSYRKKIMTEDEEELGQKIMDNFEEALDNLANDWLEESVYMIEEKAGILNMVALLSVGAVIAWAVMGTFEMQDQITSSMGGS